MVKLTHSAKLVRGRKTLTVHVKTAKYHKPSSNRWLERQLNDPYVAESKRLGYRSRAAFKLIQLDEKYHFLGKGKTIVDLGCANRLPAHRSFVRILPRKTRPISLKLC